MTEQLEKLKRRLVDAPHVRDSNALLNDYLEDAEQYILGYTGRESLPDALKPAQIALAVLYVNRMGMEGETGHGEGGISRSVDALPKDIAAQLNRYRLATAPGSRGYP